MFCAELLVRVIRRSDGSLDVSDASAGRGVWVGPAPECLATTLPQMRRGFRAEVTRDAFEALAASWEKIVVARGRAAAPPPGCPRSGNTRRGQ